MADEDQARSDPGEDERPFGWAGARRRFGAGEASNPAPGAAEPAQDAHDELPGIPRLRPSGQFGAGRRRWGAGTDLSAAPASDPETPSPRPLPLRPTGTTGPAPAPEPTPAPEAAGRRRAPEHRPASSTPTKGNPQAEAAKTRLHELLIEELEHGVLEGLDPGAQREAVVRAARELIVQEQIPLAGMTRDELVEAVADEVLGLGPLEPLLRDPSVSEIMVNDLDKIFFEQEGRIFRSPARFRDKQHVMRIIERIVAPLGRRIDEASPMVDARLPDGSRVNVTIPPVSPKAASITIRKFRADKMRMADLIAVGALSDATAEFLAMCIRAKLNIIISGGTGTGKTTMLNALSSFIPNTERIVTIEDPSELRLQQEHVITLEARPPSIEGKNAIHQRDLVRNSLRMRPDRIIIGEVRGAECFDMLQAMNTGHEGSISTVHANNPRDAIARMENLVLMAGLDMPMRAIREQIASAIDVIIQVQRLQDGSRKVTHVTEVSGMEGEVITLQDVFLFKLDHIDHDGRVRGSMLPTGLRPSFVEKFAMAGIDFPTQLFDSGKEW